MTLTVKIYYKTHCHYVSKIFTICDPTPRNKSLGQILNWVILKHEEIRANIMLLKFATYLIRIDWNLTKVVMVSTWWHPPIVIKVLWRKLPLKQRKSNCFKEEGMPISINIIACLECSCHIWVPQLVYFDKIHHDCFFSLFSNAQSDSFRGVGSHLWTNKWIFNENFIIDQRRELDKIFKSCIS
jgi:hypothetical protein